MLNKIIFAIDNDTDVRAVAKFLHHIDVQRAIGTLQGSFVHCIGCYDGALEASYMMDEIDYRKVVSGFTDNQECIMHVPADTRQPCTLEYSVGDSFSIGPMRQVQPQDALSLTAWTYVMETATYWTTDV